MNPQSRSISDFGVRKHRPDYGLLVLATILLSIGLIVIYAISPALAAQDGKVGGNYFVIRQLIAIAIGLLFFWAASNIPLSFWLKSQKLLLAGSFGLCLLAVILGQRGSRWIELGLFSFQPVELVKFTAVILFSAFIVKVVASGKANTLNALKPALIVFGLFAFVIVVLQRDLGSTVVLMTMIAAMAYIADFPMKRLLVFGGIALAIIILAINSTAYRRDRFLTFLQPERDCQVEGYHACQALIAVGSGGVFGVGVGKSVQAYGYLPEAKNDSIFAIYAEKFGFIGTLTLVGLIGALLLRIIAVMQRAPNKTTQVLCAGVFAWLSVQSVVNIGAMVGLLPLKGITLPFISYGGTSLIFVMAALGLVFQVSKYTTMRKNIATQAEGARTYENTHGRGRVSRPYYPNPKRS